MVVTEMDTLEQVEAMEDSMGQLQEDYPEKTHYQEWKFSKMNLRTTWYPTACIMM